MKRKTVTRLDMSEVISRKFGLPRNYSSKLVDSVLEKMSGALIRGEKVKISRFATFACRRKAARIGRNPKTGETAPIHPRRVVSFVPSNGLRARVARVSEK